MKILKENITDAAQPLILHGCNCMGKMGSGVAKAIRAKWPLVFEQYNEYIHQLILPPIGCVQFVHISKELAIGNCFTQERYGYDGKKYASYCHLVDCLYSDVKDFCKLYNVIEIATVPIGAGLGGLKKEFVLDLFQEFEEQTKIKVFVYDLEK